MIRAGRRRPPHGGGNAGHGRPPLKRAGPSGYQLAEKPTPTPWPWGSVAGPTLKTLFFAG